MHKSVVMRGRDDGQSLNRLLRTRIAAENMLSANFKTCGQRRIPANPYSFSARGNSDRTVSEYSGSEREKPFQNDAKSCPLIA